ncbi:MAG: aspartate transaminase, partial [Ruegeria sp.]|nr:aspartate transaminase [Ruegeria sp.]
LLGRITPDGKELTSSTDLAAYFLEHGAVVVPGPGFSCDPFFRMSIATSEDNIIKGIRRMKSAVEVLS